MFYSRYRSLLTELQSFVLLYIINMCHLGGFNIKYIIFRNNENFKILNNTYL
jgi:hypothetical protein